MATAFYFDTLGRMDITRKSKGSVVRAGAQQLTYALRNNTYPAALTDLVGAAEGMAEVPKCPLGQAYTYDNPATTGDGTCKIVLRPPKDDDDTKKQQGTASPDKNRSGTRRRS